MPETSDNRAAEAYLDALLEAAVDGIVVIDERGIIHRINNAALKMFGYQDKELLGHNVKRLMFTQDASNHDHYIQRYLNTGEAAIIGIGRQVEGRRSDGSRIPIYLSVGTIRQSDNTHFIGIVRDLTDQQAAEAEIHHLEYQLTHAGRLTTLGEMAAGIAHEINQPLTAIASFSDAGNRLAAGDGEAQELADIFREIGGQAHRAAEVVSRLRQLIRKHQLEREPHNLNDLIRNILLLIEFNTKKYNINFQIELDEQLPPASMDGVQIQQIVLNLVNNAMESFSHKDPDSPRTVKVSTDSDPRWVKVTVSDNGAGVAEADREQLFQPFFTTKPKGVGLGLSICHSIAEAHNGRLGYQPLPEGGSEFMLQLPIDRVG